MSLHDRDQVPACQLLISTQAPRQKSKVYICPLDTLNGRAVRPQRRTMAAVVPIFPAFCLNLTVTYDYLRKSPLQ